MSFTETNGCIVTFVYLVTISPRMGIFVGYYQELIELPTARGHATVHTHNIDGEIFRRY